MLWSRKTDPERELDRLRRVHAADPEGAGHAKAFLVAYEQVHGHPLVGDLLSTSGKRARLEVRALGGCETALHLTIRGSLDGYAVAEFQGAVQDLVEQGCQRYFLDMSQIAYLGSMFAVLFKLHDSLAKTGGGIVLFSLPKKIQLVFDMLELSPLLPVYDDFRAAWPHFKG